MRCRGFRDEGRSAPPTRVSDSGNVVRRMAKSGQDLGGPLRAQVEQRDGATVVSINGTVTELADFMPLTQLRGPLRFDLAGIERINSLGVRSWTQFVKAAEDIGLSLTFERVSPAMVQQISMISNFMGSRSRVRSLLVPYLCISCHHEHLQLVEVTPGIALAVPPRVTCAKCAAAMELDEVEAIYSSLFAKA